MAVTEHILGSLSFNRSSIGLEVTDQFLVTGLSGRPTEILGLAMNEQKIPRYGDRFIDDASLSVINVHSKFASRDSTTSAIVTIKYAFAQPKDLPPGIGAVQIETGTTMQTVQTEFDALGNLIQVYHDEFPNQSPPTGTAKFTVQTVRLAVQIPMHMRRFTRTEFADPSLKDEKYSGTVNKVLWQRWPVGHWLCTGIRGLTNDAGATYSVTYDFLLNKKTLRVSKEDPTLVPFGWLGTGTTINPKTGQQYEKPSWNLSGTLVIANSDANKADIMAFHVYPKQDFNDLGLPTSDEITRGAAQEILSGFGVR